MGWPEVVQVVVFLLFILIAFFSCMQPIEDETIWKTHKKYILCERQGNWRKQEKALLGLTKLKTVNERTIDYSLTKSNYMRCWHKQVCKDEE